MPTFAGRSYDVRPKRPGWIWIAFALDGVTPVGHGEAETKAEAEQAAKECIADVTGMTPQPIGGGER